MARRDQGTDIIHNEQSRFPIQKVIPLLINNINLQLRRKTLSDAPYIPVLKGHPGCGKTTHMKIIAKQLNLKLYYVSIGPKPMEFLSGLPITNKLTFESDKERKSTYVYWSESEIIHIANEYARDKKYKGCLLFLDDMHLADTQIQKYMFELILERKLGNYELDDNIAIVGAMNSSSQAGFEGFYSAVINRIQMLPVRLDWKYFYENVGATLNPIVAAFIRNHGNSGDILEEDERQDGPFATYRSWVQISMAIEKPYEDYLKSKDINTFLDIAYMIAASFTSPNTSLIFKNETMQILKYDYENMVKNNAYNINFNDPISQCSFGNIVRYLRSTKDVDNFVAYIEKLIKTEEVEKFQNAVVNVMYELSSMNTVYNNKLKNAEDEATKKEAQENLDRNKYCQKQLFAHGQGKIHKMMAEINNKPYELE